MSVLFVSSLINPYKVYTQVFEKHFPHIASIFQDWVNIKSVWRKQRIGAEEELAEQREPDVRQTNRNENSLHLSQNAQQKFYVSMKESYDDKTDANDSVDFQSRLAFRLVANQNTNSLVETIPKEVNIQPKNENQLNKKSLSEREISGKISRRLFMSPERNTYSRENQEKRHIRPPTSLRLSTTDYDASRNFASLTARSRHNYSHSREREVSLEDYQVSKTQNSFSLLPVSNGYSTMKTFASVTAKTRPSPSNHTLRLTPKEPLISANSEKSFKYTSPFHPIINSVAILKADSNQSLENKTNGSKGYLRLRPKLVESLKEIENISLSKGSTRLLKRMISNKHEDLSVNENSQAAIGCSTHIQDQLYLSCRSDKKIIRNLPSPRISKVPSLIDLDSRVEINFSSNHGKLDLVKLRPSDEKSNGQSENKKSRRKIIRKDGKRMSGLVRNTLQLDNF